MTKKYKRHVRSKQRKLKHYSRVKTRQRGGLNPELLKSTLLFAQASAKIALTNAKKVAKEKGIELKTAFNAEKIRAFNIAQTEVMSGNPAKDFKLTSVDEYFKNSNWPKCSNKIYIFLTKAFIKGVGGEILTKIFGNTDAEKAKLEQTNTYPSTFNSLSKKPIIYRPIIKESENSSIFGNALAPEDLSLCPLITDKYIQETIERNSDIQKIINDIINDNIELAAIKNTINDDAATKDLEDTIDEKTKQYMKDNGFGRTIEKLNANAQTLKEMEEVDGGRKTIRRKKHKRRTTIRKL